ncbi:MAG: Glu-tRNA(Gln) amidotransferase subunit GatE [Bacteroidales bacterium]|nr:Glu-tRNA(Gln) amidotransferase subunit GatE [Bacteroidales bacterium]
MQTINPQENYEKSRKEIGYVDRKEATQADYDRIGFKSGLEVHQQLATKEKLFCRCPAGIFQKPDEYDAELLRHMRPTLSEMGEYDGTALMEFKTRKNIIYRIAHRTACTYEVDDTPPFPINPEALQYALEIALASKLKIVGEVHITRKQYLDGSIPTGFQRTAILGIDGEIQLKNKKVRLIQLSVEEDACREVSDIGHTRIYRTDRLGMPLIETVTYPEMVNPDEVEEACNYIRFLNRSTGRVRTGIGAGREDVNVSCTGGTRIEVKGVAHTKWIPEVTHVECFRQWALLAIREQLKARIKKEDWKMSCIELDPKDFHFYFDPITDAIKRGEKVYAVNLPQFAGLLSHFTQPGHPFYCEFADRLKVIACLERPNMATSEDLEDVVSRSVFEKAAKAMNAGDNDAQIIFWAPEDDVKTALETIEERALMTFDGVPFETRKALTDGTTIFERVLPGADRMYPDTDSAPIPLSAEYIENLQKNVPDAVSDRYAKMVEWGVPEDCFKYIFTHNFFPLIKKITDELGYCPKYLGTFFGHKLKHWHGQNGKIPFSTERLYELFGFVKKEGLDKAIAADLLKLMFENPTATMDELLQCSGFKKASKEEIKASLKEAASGFKPMRKRTSEQDKCNALLGKVRSIALGNLSLNELANESANF